MVAWGLGVGFGVGSREEVGEDERLWLGFGSGCGVLGFELRMRACAKWRGCASEPARVDDGKPTLSAST